MADKYLFKLLEFRSLILLAVLVAGVAVIHFSGPFELQTPVDRRSEERRVGKECRL